MRPHLVVGSRRARADREASVLSSATEAVAWACGVLRKHGAVVFIDGTHRPLEDVLAFVREDSKLCS